LNQEMDFRTRLDTPRHCREGKHIAGEDELEKGGLGDPLEEEFKTKLNKSHSHAPLERKSTYAIIISAKKRKKERT